MCIIYSSYIQHLTNKRKERQTTEKSTVGSEAQRRWELFECKWVPMSAPHAGRVTGWGRRRRRAAGVWGGGGRVVGCGQGAAIWQRWKGKSGPASAVVNAAGPLVNASLGGLKMLNAELRSVDTGAQTAARTDIYTRP